MCGWDVTTWKQHRTAWTHQKKVHDISSTEGKHGVHRVLHSHKVPGQQRDTRRVHLLHKKHSQWLRHTRQTLSSRTCGSSAASHFWLCLVHTAAAKQIPGSSLCSLVQPHIWEQCVSLAKWTPMQNTTGVWAAQGRSNPTWIHGLQQAAAWYRPCLHSPNITCPTSAPCCFSKRNYTIDQWKWIIKSLEDCL